MTVIETTSRTLIIKDIPKLDTITVMITQFNSRSGKIIIECHGKSWSAYWGAMSQPSLAEFFIQCDNHYLIKNLSSLQEESIDPDWRYNGTGDYNPRLLPNPEYKYLSRIVDTIKEAFKLHKVS